MRRTNERTKIAVGIALVLALMPGAAFASTATLEVAASAASVEEFHSTSGSSGGQVAGRSSGASTLQDDAVAGDGPLSQVDAGAGDGPLSQVDAGAGDGPLGLVDGEADGNFVNRLHTRISQQREEAVRELEEAAQLAAGNKLLAYNRADIEAVGTQAATGHTICCPSFSCAYADAVMDGTIHGHEYYTCSCCTWTDWGGGNSSYRSVGADEQLLREAHDQILAGRPTVVHVSASYGEHWIALIGFEGATDPDHLTLANFIALDPWDGAQINAASRFALYGDGCEHVSDR